jgi:hypothetical protein
VNAGTESGSGTAPVRRRVGAFLRHNSLGLFFLVTFLIALAGQTVAGRAEFNNQLVAEGLAPVGFAAYLTSSDFAVDVTENWQSEYLQFFLYIFGTVWLLQRGSPESKELHKAGPESDKDQMVGRHARADSPRWAARTDWRGLLYSRSLGLVMGGFFLLSWLTQSVTGVAALQRTAVATAPGPDQLARLSLLRGLLEPHPAELAVRTARRRLHGRPLHLSEATRITGVEARRRAPLRHRRRGLSGTCAAAVGRSVPPPAGGGNHPGGLVERRRRSSGG